jgi:hypothetical protein
MEEIVDTEPIGPKNAKSPVNRLGFLLEFSGVADGTRTHDDRNHNPGLYQLSYSHHWYRLLFAGVANEEARLYE